MKTTMKQLAAGTFIALILLVGNVKAEGTETKASGREAIETTLQLEKWMTDEATWNVNAMNISEINQETETDIQIENWMTSERTWNFNSNLVEDTEPAMEVESWMTNETTWNNYNNVEETETVLTVESWMTNNNIWNR
jgi:hypothetical protein